MKSNLIKKNISQSIIQLDKQLYFKLLEQLNKDFNLCGIQWDDYTEVPPENLFTAIDNIIQTTLQKESDTTIYALLYRIDISEKAIHQTNITRTEEITTLILSREMEKIWLRLQFSK